jgi:hypothetical protein
MVRKAWGMGRGKIECGSPGDTKGELRQGKEQDDDEAGAATSVTYT